MSQERDQLDHSDHHHPSEKLDEISSHPSAVPSVEHEGEDISSLDQVQGRTPPADGSSGDDDLDVEHVSEEMEESSLKPEGNHEDDDHDDNGDEREDDSFYDYTDDNDYYDEPQIYESFEHDYHCFPLSRVDKTHLQIGNKIIMPADALMPLMVTKISMPMQFEIENKSTGKVSHCGVFEFTGEDASVVYLPDWMMKNMQLHEGDPMTIKSKDLEKGTFIKLQPHSSDFLRISNTKAVLEENLQSFSCLTMDDTIMIRHENKNLYIDIVETKPSSAISIIDADCDVDFAPPLDYKEPEKPAAKCLFGKQKEEANQTPKFKPFTGLARRLVEPIPTELDSTSLPIENGRIEAAEAERTSKRSQRELVLESDRSQPRNKGEVLTNETVEAETSTFQPFTGKKYTLAG